MVVNRIELLNALKRIKFCVNNDSVLPSIMSVMFDTSKKEGTLTLHGTNPETYITEKVTVSSVSADDKKLINFRWLFMVVENSFTETLTITEGGDFVVISGKNTHAYVPDDNSDNFPRQWKKTETDAAYHFVSKTEAFRKNIANAYAFMSKDQLRPSMTGVYLTRSVDGKFIEMCATDAHRLFYCDSGLAHKPSEDFGNYIIPNLAVNFLAKNNLGVCSFAINEDRITISNEITCYSARLINARYPDFRKVIPESKGDFILHINRKEFTNCVKLAAMLAESSTKQISVKIDRASGVDKLKIYVEDKDWSGMESIFEIENFKIEMFGDGSISKYVVALNGNFLLQTLKCYRYEDVTFRCSGINTRPVFIDDDILIMPLMLNNN